MIKKANDFDCKATLKISKPSQVCLFRDHGSCFCSENPLSWSTRLVFILNNTVQNQQTQKDYYYWWIRYAITPCSILVYIGSGNCLVPVRYQAFNWANVENWIVRRKRLQLNLNESTHILLHDGVVEMFSASCGPFFQTSIYIGQLRNCLLNWASYRRKSVICLRIDTKKFH